MQTNSFKLVSHLTIKYTIILVLFIFNSCNDHDNTNLIDCDFQNIQMNIQMTKVSTNCSDLDVPYELSFGSEFQFTLGSTCDKTCDYRQIAYDFTTSYSRDFKGKFIETKYINCGSSFSFNKKELEVISASNSSSAILELGDTIIFHFHTPRLCTPNDLTNCSESKPLDLPEFMFKYIIIEEDIDCE